MEVYKTYQIYSDIEASMKGIKLKTIEVVIYHDSTMARFRGERLYHLRVADSCVVHSCNVHEIFNTLRDQCETGWQHPRKPEDIIRWKEL